MIMRKIGILLCCLLLVLPIASATFVSAETNFITLETYSKPFDLIQDKGLEYLAKAKTYDTNDYSYTYVEGLPVAAFKKFAKVGWSYAQPEKVESAVVLVSLYPDMRDAVEGYSGSDTSASLRNLFTGVTYYWTVTATLTDGSKKTSAVGTFKTNPGVRFISIDRFSNCRDMGGWVGENGVTVKEGLAYRSVCLDTLKEDTLATIQRVLHAKTDLDFRGNDEKAEQYRNASPLGSDVQYASRPIASYKGFFEASKHLSFEGTRVFADWDNYPILCHCAGGADRTGTIVAAIHALLGVSENDIVADYELTPLRTRNGTEPYNCSFMELIKAIDGKDLQEKTYNFYHVDGGLSAMELSNIYNIFMTDSAVFRSESLSVPTVSSGQSVEFVLYPRDTDNISGVTLNGAKVDYQYNRSSGKLTLTVPPLNNGLYDGNIALSDGNSLQYEVDIDSRAVATTSATTVPSEQAEKTTAENSDDTSAPAEGTASAKYAWIWIIVAATAAVVAGAVTVGVVVLLKKKPQNDNT